jgi:UDP-GlcNAc:undecaprenyl-phosphate GlcNAc-1-phosphate transferase
LWDDYRNISPLIKLAGQLLGAILLIRMGVAVRVFESPEFFGYIKPGLGENLLVNQFLDWLLTILWVVGITNSLNFVDSMDGLATGLSGLVAGFFLLLTIATGQHELAIFSASILGACAGLYFYNAYPAKLFLGDSGAQILGFFLASLAIALRPIDAHQSSSWLTPIVLLGVPIFDMALVIFSRFRSRRPLATSARDHTYHRLARLGLEPNRAVLVMHLCCLALGCIALQLLYLPPGYAVSGFFILLIVGAGLILWLDREGLSS